MLTFYLKSLLSELKWMNWKQRYTCLRRLQTSALECRLCMLKSRYWNSWEDISYLISIAKRRPVMRLHDDGEQTLNLCSLGKPSKVMKYSVKENHTTHPVSPQITDVTRFGCEIDGVWSMGGDSLTQDCSSLAQDAIMRSISDSGISICHVYLDTRGLSASSHHILPSIG